MAGNCTDTWIVKGFQLISFAFDNYLSPFDSRNSTKCIMDWRSWLNAHLMSKIFPMQGALRPADTFYLGAKTDSLVSLTGVAVSPRTVPCPQAVLLARTHGSRAWLSACPCHFQARPYGLASYGRSVSLVKSRAEIYDICRLPVMTATLTY